VQGTPRRRRATAAAAGRGRRLVFRHRAAPARRAKRHAHPRGARRLDRGSRLPRRSRADDRRGSRRALAAAARVLARPRPPGDCNRGASGGVMSVELVHELAPARLRVRRSALRWHHLPLAGILALAASLDFWSLSQNGYANTYYSGAVRSMLK